ncbi:hypothetical protein A3C39_05760 [Candidatus Saccharibacteria bacterium RIFCSPHIGHO2_02_FULL_46_12]|nr:MAG: hypothetical protein A3C39_05760 [Candidatus Saccharibacteria bacterium RIFCSPHIGHO2_02_FULL_46_12]
MPKVQVRLDRRLAPLLYDLGSSELSDSQKHNYEAARILVQDCIPNAVVHAMNAVSTRTYDASEIIVIPEPFHEWAFNAPSVEIVIEPGDIDAPFAERKVRRAQIASSAAHELAHNLYYANAWVHNSLQKAVGQPTFDVECRPISGSGQTFELARHGSIHIFNEWGMQ